MVTEPDPEVEYLACLLAIGPPRKLSSMLTNKHFVADAEYLFVAFNWWSKMHGSDFDMTRVPREAYTFWEEYKNWLWENGYGSRS